MNKSWTISRRTFLRGAGAAIGLPVLEAMMPGLARAQQAGRTPPRRIVALFVPNGINMRQWTPATEGGGYELTPSLTDLARVKEDVLVLSGLSNLSGRASNPGDHARGTGCFLTCRAPFLTNGANIAVGTSMDQVAAQAIGDQTLIPSLELGTDGGGSTGSCDSGYSCAYVRNIAWANENTPMAKETNPRVVFERLFGNQGEQAATSAEQAKRLRYRKSVLDYVKDDATRLQAKLGKTDQRKVAEYLSGVRALEQRIEQIEAGGEQVCTGDAPAAPTDLPARTTAMVDLAVTAMRCDLTRVVTLMMGNGGSNVTFPFIDITEQHHELSHHGNDPGKLDKLARINRWEVSQFADLAAKMKAVVEPDGTLLDNSLVFMSSEIEDGDSHAHTNMPVLVAGRGGNKFRSGRHVRYTNQPVANLFISMLQTVGVNAPTFGADGTGPLPDLV